MLENQNEKQARESILEMVKSIVTNNTIRKNLLKKATVSHMLPVIMDMKRW